MKQNNGEYLAELTRIGIGDIDGQTTEFIENFRNEDCTYADEFKNSFLQSAISSRKYDIVKFLIEQECNLDNQDDRGYTALHYILGSKDKCDHELIDTLLEKSLNLELEDDEYGNSPLMEAVINAKIPLSILENLLRKGADPHHKNKSNTSPYDMVLKYNIKELVDLFEPYV